jgi:UDP:flavonoid glycosyltransferase YjiC (YdhE family)
LEISDGLSERLTRTAAALLEDSATLERVRRVQRVMQEERGVQVAADLINDCMM